MRLYLVRHAAPSMRRDVPSPHWHLSPEGRAAADALAGQSFWEGMHEIHTSAEPKAEATAQRIAARHGLRIRVEPDLREVARPWMNKGYEDAVRRYFAAGAMDGWEPRDAALARVRGCIEGIMARHQEADLAIVSHGLALTLYLSDLLRLSSGAAYEMWSRIGLPDVADVDRKSRRLERGFGGRYGTAPIW